MLKKNKLTIQVFNTIIKEEFIKSQWNNSILEFVNLKKQLEHKMLKTPGLKVIMKDYAIQYNIIQEEQLWTVLKLIKKSYTGVFMAHIERAD